ncbi:MAG: hypothetical protein AVDCRST_MAG68-3992 [uncultured Gemmatimonadetes bacterium]|uniref:NACHT domain-containing protein n=1 Tax=uncultured Gemmatimonadota bacterium TaxID=203437 RepID=A0A6J4M647_9BACT|nr:MAG: hypothetical protein AVDCRST_MAG68-3992 [uncultured Gemmatimonadota bacterium]
MEDGRERDGIFESEEFVNLIECTVSPSKKKAEEDSEKLSRLIRKYEVKHPTKHVKGWFITLKEPTADQKTSVERRKERIVAISYDQFRSKLVDARTYLTLRAKHAFGSVRDPETGAAELVLDYVPLDILDREGGTYSVKVISEGLNLGGRFMLMGDYGAGKSSTMREIFHVSAKRFWDLKTLRFPVMLNLRDHHGQTDPSEALERHARKIGFSSPTHLVRAWRAGYAELMLDGFDEIATAGWAGRTKKLKVLRYRSMELIRSFVRESPATTGIIIAGREHFFDNEVELSDALGISNAFRRLTLSEFSADQVTTYLRRRGWKDTVPEWLPSRPLLLGYLASRGLLQETLWTELGSSPAVGWDGLLQRVSEREAEIEAGIDADTVRTLIERLATLARSSVDGLGPLLPDQIIGAFSDVCGYTPDDRGAVLLQRLPGLGGHSSEDGARVFIDRDLAAVASAGDVLRYIDSPFVAELDSSNWQAALPPLGTELIAHRCGIQRSSPSKLGAALRYVAEQPDQGTLAADVAMVIQQMGFAYSDAKVFIRGAMVPELILSKHAGDTSRIEFQDCVVIRLDVEHDAPAAAMPVFVRCYFTRVEGRSGTDDMPPTKFVDCDFESFENAAETTNALMELPLPTGSKVLLTALKKLYAQSGSGRRESAMYRGLDHRAREHVTGVLELLRKEGFAVRARIADRTIWMPSRDTEVRRRALKMLAAPSAAADPLLREAATL